MGRDKSVEEIPQWCWYNGMFMFQFDEQLKFDPSISLSDFMIKFLENQNIGNQNFYHTKNQGVVFMLLYGLLVVPKELWHDHSECFPFKTRPLFQVVIDNERASTTIGFIQMLRNAISHANYSINENGVVSFWNVYNNSMSFKVQILYSALSEFLTEIGRYYINTRNT